MTLQEVGQSIKQRAQQARDNAAAARRAMDSAQKEVQTWNSVAAAWEGALDLIKEIK